MVEIRNVGNGRFEVFAEDLHWEAFTSEQRALDTAASLARKIGVTMGIEPSEVKIKHFQLSPAHQPAYAEAGA